MLPAVTHSSAQPGCLQRRELAGCISCRILKKCILPLTHVQSLAQPAEQREAGSFFLLHPSFLPWTWSNGVGREILTAVEKEEGFSSLVLPLCSHAAMKGSLCALLSLTWPVRDNQHGFGLSTELRLPSGKITELLCEHDSSLQLTEERHKEELQLFSKLWGRVAR